MVDYKELISNMLRDAGIEKDEFDCGAEKIYRDEPIMRTASQIDNDTPEIYRQLRRIASSPEAVRHSDAWVFCKQGRLIAELEDDCEYPYEFTRYYPTYQLMSDRQLRGYVTWRTGYRKGKAERTSLSFIFVYIYELLNLIGVESAEDAFRRLVALQQAYIPMYPQLKMYLDTWMGDFVAYYGLDSSLYYSAFDMGTDEAMIVLKRRTEHSNDEVFSALCSLSAYKLHTSKFYRDFPEDVKAVTCRVYDAYSEYCDRHRKKGLFETLFGIKVTIPFYRMFSSAVFYDSRKYKDHVYEVNELRKYSCCNGMWSRECYPVANDRNRELGKLLKAIDAIMRRKYGYKNQLKFDDYTKLVGGIIDKETENYLLDKKKKQRPKIEIEIDMSKLGGIRAAADITRDKLITEEDEAPDPVPAPVSEHEEKTVELDTSNEAGLDETEYRFIRCLLYGEDHKALLAEKKQMLSVIVDSVNEKLYDIFADTVIEFDCDDPVLIEDYTEELRGIAK